MMSTEGSTTACDKCLVVTAVGFALPHAMIAIRQFAAPQDHRWSGTFLAMSTEASTLGPQLCVLWSTADVHGHAGPIHQWVFSLTTLAFVCGVLACAAAPPLEEGMAMPPSGATVLSCLLLDFAATVMLVMTFPYLRDWFFWMLVVFLFVPS